MSIFDETTDIAKFRSEPLLRMGIGAAAAAALPDSYLWGKLRAAEAAVGRVLRVPLEPTLCLPDSTPQADLDALAAAGTPYLIEPGYDYDPEDYQGDAWGMIQLRQRPVVSLGAVTFSYPLSASPLFTVPSSQIRVDRKYGRLNLIGLSVGPGYTLGGMILSAVTASRTAPLMIQVRYTAGLDVASDYPDLLDLIYKQASLLVVGDEFRPQSGSVSADGLSQSSSFDGDKHQDSIDHKLGQIRTAIMGVQVMAL